MMLERQLEQQEGRGGVVLALDTSTAAMAAALLRGGKVLGEVQTMAERNHSVHVISLIKQMMLDAGVEAGDVEAIAPGIGPGSYTGVRIAVTAAKTLAWAWDKRLAGVSSLEALAYGSIHRGLGKESANEAAAGMLADIAGEHWVLPIMDARRGQVYTAGFALRRGEWSRSAQDGIRLMKEWVDAVMLQLSSHLSSAGELPTVWISGDLTQHEDEAARLRELAGERGCHVRLLPYTMEGRYLALLGQRALEQGKDGSVHALVPNYTQLTEAEVKLKARQAGEGQA